MSGTSFLKTPKNFFVQERNRFYSQWHLAWFRECFQNSIDAGAKRIDVRIEEAEGKGSFGRDPNQPRVTRITFADDGCGMTREILDNVFFAIGETTKKDAETTGGFGRARLMTLFANSRYKIVTQDRVVEGDGSEYVNMSRAEAAQALADWRDRDASEADLAAGDEEKASLLRASARGHQADLDAVGDLSARYPGCLIEVDFDPNDGEYASGRPTVERMRRALDEYLRQSELDCEVTVNGEAVQPTRRKGKARRRLMATMAPDKVPASWSANPKIEILERPDGQVDVAFATVKVVEPGQADGIKGELVVRVNGASMFTRSTGAEDGAVLLELNRAIAREVMTSNRDGLKAPYSDALDAFLRTLATDSREALKREEEKKFTVLHGGKSHKIAQARKREVDFTLGANAVAAALSTGGQARIERIKNRHQSVYYDEYSWRTVTRAGLAGVPWAEMQKLFEALVASPETADAFFESVGDQAKARTFVTTLERQGPSAALEYASGPLLGHIVTQLKVRMALAEESESKRFADRLSDLHDVPIMTESLSPDPDRVTDPKERKEKRAQLLSAMRKTDPRQWDAKAGKGQTPRKILALWQVAVDNCVAALMDEYPNLDPFPYAAGWYFSQPTYGYSSVRGESGWQNARAMFVRPDPNETMRHFLLNPVDDDTFKLAFNPHDPDDRDRILAYAAHEVAHVVAEKTHDETFAGALTAIMKRLGMREMRRIHKEMDDAVKTVARLYAGGRTRIVALDHEDGPRPAERFLSGLDDRASLAVTRGPSGIEVDCDALDEAEADLGSDPSCPSP